MNYFRSHVIAASGNTADLVVTCDAAFAGLTITCTNGTDTYTETCPSVSPYVVTFSGLAADTWTISATVGGQPISDIVDTTHFDVTFEYPITFTLYSAPLDTITYSDGGSPITLGTTDANGELSVTLSAGTYTFYSSVAKDPSNLANDYSKSITVSSGMSTAYLMPDYALYWYGFEKTPITSFRQQNAGTITKNTNNITLSKYVTTGVNNASIYTQNVFNLDGKSKISIIIKFGDTSTYYERIGYQSTPMDGNTVLQHQLTVSTSTQYASYTLPSNNLGDQYVGYETNCFPSSTTIYALFVE